MKSRLLIFSLFFIMLLVSCGNKIPDSQGFKDLHLYAYDSKSQKLALSAGSSARYLYYYLNEEDLQAGMLSSSGKIPEALEVIFKEPSADSDVVISFLYPEDFTDGKMNSKLGERPLARASLSAGKKTSVSLAFPKNQQVKGFLVYSESSVVIDDVAKVYASVGWREAPGLSERKFGPEGGDMSSLTASYVSSLTSMDFNASVQLSRYFDSSVQEYLVIHFRNDSSDAGENGSQRYFDFSAEGKKIHILRSPEPQTEQFYAPYLFGSGSRHIEISEGSDMLTGIEWVFVPVENAFAESGERLPSAVVTDLGTILDWPASIWQRKDFELFQWNIFPDVLVFDFKNYTVQDRYLKRLAFYVEKAGYKGKLWKNEDIADMHGWNAHDYNPESLADFYTKALDENFTLDAEEYLLRDILLNYGIICRKADGSGYLPGYGGIVSISKESSSGTRQLLLAHESYHGVYFVDEAFRNKVLEVYEKMDAKSLQFLQGYFSSQSSLNYDVNDSYLMQNEMMSYLLQQTVKNQAWYFSEKIAGYRSVKETIPELTEYVRKTKAAGFTEAAAWLDDYVFSRWGLNGGRTWMITVSQ